MAAPTISLDVIEVKEPCPASWEAMRGDDRVRFCDGCQKHVHNLAAMTSDEAKSLLETCTAAGSLCLRFARSAEGVVETLDYRPSPRRGRGWRFWAGFATCLAAAAGAVNAYVFRTSIHLPPPFPQPPPARQMMLGVVCPTPAPPQTPTPAPPAAPAAG